MVKFHKKYVANPDNSYGGLDPEGKQVMKFRISADQFFNLVIRRDEFGDFPSLIEGILNTYDTRASSERQRANLFNGRYRKHIRCVGLIDKIHGHEGNFPNVAIKTLDGYPELCAAPDLRVNYSKDGIMHRDLVVFHDVSKSLNGLTLQQANDDERIHLPVHQPEGQDWIIRMDEAIWYTAAGLFRAFPEDEAHSCHYVVYGPEPDNMVPDNMVPDNMVPDNMVTDNMVVIPIYRNDPEITRISTPETFRRLQEFYFGAVLPELAHSRREAGFELRKTLIDKSIRDLVIHQCIQR